LTIFTSPTDESSDTVHILIKTDVFSKPPGYDSWGCVRASFCFSTSF